MDIYKIIYSTDPNAGTPVNDSAFYFSESTSFQVFVPADFNGNEFQYLKIGEKYYYSLGTITQLKDYLIANVINV